jgi:hypothetical protein
MPNLARRVPPRQEGIRLFTSTEAARAALLETVTEAEFGEWLESQFFRFGWRYMHIRDARRQNVTGFPDYLALRGGRQIVAEIKKMGRRPTPGQRGWLAAFAGVPGVESYVWTPKDMRFIEERLEGLVA